MFHNVPQDRQFLSKCIDDSVSLLSNVLASFEHHLEQRRKVTDVLFDVVQWDIEFGGIHMGEEAWESILNHAGKEERRSLIDRIEEKLDGKSDESSSWTKKRFGRLLADLYLEADRSEALLETAERLELHEVQVSCLIENGAFESAVRVISDHICSARQTIQYADWLLEMEEVEKARQIVEEYAEEEEDKRLDEWIAQFEAEYGDPEKAFQIERALFGKNPSVKRFRTICSLGEAFQSVEELQEELQNQLRDQEDWETLTNIFLEQEKWDRAWEAAKKVTGYSSGSLRAKVIRESKENRPVRAVNFYRNRAKELIDKRGRGNYSSAADYLKNVQCLYEKMGNEEEWKRCMKQFRQYADNLPACRDEFRKAGL